MTQRPWTAPGGFARALLLQEGPISRRPRSESTYQALEDKEVLRSKLRSFRREEIAFLEFLRTASAVELRDPRLADLRLHHSCAQRRARSSRKASTPETQAPGRAGVRPKERSWEALGPADRVRKLRTILEAHARHRSAQQDGTGAEAEDAAQEFWKLLDAVSGSALDAGATPRRQPPGGQKENQRDAVLSKLVETVLGDSCSLQAAFDSIDSSGRGRISRQAWAKGLKTLGVTHCEPAEAAKLLGWPDSPGSELTCEAFIDALSPYLARAMTSLISRAQALDLAGQSVRAGSIALSRHQSSISASRRSQVVNDFKLLVQKKSLKLNSDPSKRHEQIVRQRRVACVDLQGATRRDNSSALTQAEIDARRKERAETVETVLC